MDMDADAFKRRSAHLKKVAFLSVTLSTVAVATCLVAFPMVFTYVQQLQAEVDQDVSYCKMRSRDLWQQVADVQGGAVEIDTSQLAKTIGHIKAADPYADASRILVKRQSFFSRNDMFCCTCHRGQAGRAGNSGSDGPPGVDGLNGRPGNPGQPASNVDSRANFPPQCPCESDRGPPGLLGNKGPPGLPGSQGNDGQPGSDGNDGRNGPKGPPGRGGSPGRKGGRGDPGEARRDVGRPGSPGQQGSPGNSGRPGSPGQSGSDGNPGSRGALGDAGRRGNDGRNGNNGQRGRPGGEGFIGSCDHCPAARLAPGY